MKDAYWWFQCTYNSVSYELRIIDNFCCISRNIKKFFKSVDFFPLLECARYMRVGSCQGHLVIKKHNQVNGEFKQTLKIWWG